MKDLNILIVEDDSQKFLHIKNHILKNKEHAFSLFFMQANSVTDAINKIEEKQPDILILDISLPTFNISNNESGGRARHIGGVEILDFMDLMSICCKTIILTGYEAFLIENKPIDFINFKNELIEDFPNIIHDVLFYNSINANWKSKILEYIY
ncbi:hypothetical protein F909_03796 [Acinetobacter sp. ANC 3929]|uniref:response regulator n=1 Tax=Acinetobacter TaxID=469 RepID=UPI0002D00212|nr:MULTISPECIES: response regulator [Acinetobacter]APR70783.1 response regulator [Acinetobacter haemolyticus]ENW78113.1 hypothetical protein F909_03796 [Acinetobacter sp. ANC 3929]